MQVIWIEIFLNQAEMNISRLLLQFFLVDRSFGDR